MPDCGCNIEIRDKEQRRVLIPLLLINGLMFVIELTLGIIGQSTGLIADSMDMLADATVYAIAMYAVGRGLQAKIRAAHISGVLQIVLAFGVMLDVIRRFTFGSNPESTLMIVMGLVAFAANVVCLILIARHRKGEIHMRASWVFSKNDVIANIGVIVSGGLVAWLSSPLPDLIIGFAISGPGCGWGAVSGGYSPAWRASLCSPCC